MLAWPASAEPTAVIADTSRGGGHSGGVFFVLEAVDGRAVDPNALSASRRASYGKGIQMRVVLVERAVPAGRRRLKLSAAVGYAAPVQGIFSRRAGSRVEGEVDVDLKPGVRYRVNGQLDGFRQELWLEEEGVRPALAVVMGSTRQLPMPADAGYACCNLRYDDNAINDTNHISLPFVPLGTRVSPRSHSKWRTEVWVDGRPMVIDLEYNRELETREQFLGKLVVPQDPRARVSAYPAEVREAIHQGKVLLGMTKEQVIIALGYPRSDFTVGGLAASRWVYSLTEDEQVILNFDDAGRLESADGGEVALSVLLAPGRTAHQQP